MKAVIKSILWVALVLFGHAAWAEDRGVEWRWIHTQSGFDGWTVIEGKVDVEIQNGSLRVQLCGVKGIYAPCFDVVGTVKFDKSSAKTKGIRTGKVTALVTWLNSDMSPSTFSGSYWGSTYDFTDEENAAPESGNTRRPLHHTEVITLSDTVSIIGLTRSWADSE